MGITVWPVDAVGGAPEYSGRDLRQALSPALAGATAARPLGALSGVRPGTPADTVEVSGSTWTCHPHAGVIDGQSAAEAGPYWYAVDADVTGPVDAANATNPRQDLIYARISDPAESDGSTDPEVEILYLAGTAASSPTPPATPARSIPLAVLNVPKAGGGATTVTWVAPYMAAPGGFVYVRNATERAALAAAWAPTAENPLVVWRGDADPGREHEYTTNGTDWLAIGVVRGETLETKTYSIGSTTNIAVTTELAAATAIAAANYPRIVHVEADIQVSGVAAGALWYGHITSSGSSATENVVARERFTFTSGAAVGGSLHLAASFKLAAGATAQPRLWAVLGSGGALSVTATDTIPTTLRIHVRPEM
jgi:hypothetical protein